jgi:hypothetical protein
MEEAAAAGERLAKLFTEQMNKPMVKKSRKRKYWALINKETGAFVGNPPMNNVLLMVPIAGRGEEPEIPPMQPPGYERVHVEIRILKYPDRKKGKR